MERVAVTTWVSSRQVQPHVLRMTFIWSAAISISIFLARSATQLHLSHPMYLLAMGIVAVGTLLFGSFLGYRGHWLEMLIIPAAGCFGFFLAVILSEMVVHGPIAGFFLGLLVGVLEGFVMYFVYLALLALGGLAGFAGRMLFGRAG